MPVFTRENAREYARKGNIARWHTPKPPEPPPRPEPPLADYVAAQLARTRKQIEICNDILEDPATDWKARKATADAKARLYEIEAALAGRPKPGMLRPVAQRQSRQAPGSAYLGPPPDSTPAQVQAPPSISPAESSPDSVSPVP